MANQICLLSAGEAEDFEVRGVKPDCQLHSHVPKDEAFRLTAPRWMYYLGRAEEAVARWVGPRQIVMIKEHTWRAVDSLRQVVGPVWKSMQLVER